MARVEIEMTLRLGIDTRAWAMEYGCAPDEVAEDARSYAETQLSQSAAAESGAITTVQMLDYREV